MSAPSKTFHVELTQSTVTQVQLQASSKEELADALATESWDELFDWLDCKERTHREKQASIHVE